MSELQTENLSKWKKSVFDTYIRISKDFRTFTRFFFLARCLSMAVNHLNKISIVIFAGSFISEFDNSNYLVPVLKVVRLDVLMCKVSSGSTFALMCLILMGIDFGLKAGLFFQVYFKRNYYQGVIVFCCKVVGLMLVEVLQVPILSFCVEIFMSFSLNRTSFEYGEEFKAGLDSVKIALAVGFGYYLMMIGFDLILNNKPKYSRNSWARAYSLIIIKEFIIVVIVIVCKISINSKFFYFISIACSIYQVFETVVYLPWFNNRINLMMIQVWTAICVASILSFMSDVYNTFSIIELVFPFLYLILILFNSEAIKSRTQTLLKKSNYKNPYQSELKIRSICFNSSQDLSTKIFNHFSKSTKEFFSFKLQYIWESLIISKCIQDPSLALMKLSKVKLSDYIELTENIRSNFRQDFRYPVKFEIDYLHYQIFCRLIKKVPEMGFDILLLSYSSHLRDFVGIEKKLLRKFQNFTYSFSQQVSDKSFDKKLNSIGRNVRKYFDEAKKMMNRFGDEKEISKLFHGFCDDVLKVDNSKIGKKSSLTQLLRKNLSRQLLSFDNCGAVLVISGNLSSLGRIVYANRTAATLLNYDTIQDVIGLSYLKMIPYPFNEIHNNTLVKFIMYRNSPKLNRDHLCVIDQYGNCVEVCMYFRMSFYKSSTYFIINLKQILPEQNIILASVHGEIYSVSSRVDNFIPDISKDLFSSIPNFKNYLEKHQEAKVFYYDEGFLKLYMKYKYLKIENYKLLMIYVNSENLMQFHNDRNFKEITENLLNDLSKKVETLDNNERLNEEFDKIKRENRWKQYSLATKVFEILIKVFSILQIVVMIGILITVYEIVDGLTLNYMIFDIGLMRYLSSSTLSNIFSLDLLNQNYSLAFNETIYRNNIKDNINRFEYLLSKYQSLTIPVTLESKKYFDHQDFTTYLEINEKSYEESETLLNFMQKFISFSLKISNTTLSDFSSIEDQKKFIYKNIPTNYMSTLNKTVFKIMDDFTLSLSSIFRYLEYFELISIFFPALLLIFSTTCLCFIESGNRTIWSLINNINIETLTEFRKTLIVRLRNTHKTVENLEHIEKVDLKFHYKMIIIKPFIILSIFLFISIAFYFTITRGKQQLLIAMIEQDLVHTNFGGLRRMMAPLSLFWARNAALESIKNNSFADWFISNPVGSSLSRLNFLISEYSRSQNLLMNLLDEYPSNQYGFDEYINLMYGHSCDYITIVDNCTFTFVSNGLDPSLNFYLQELRNLGNCKDGKTALGLLIKVEKYSKLIEKSFVFGLFVYANYTTVVIDDIKAELSLTVFYFALATAVFYCLFMRTLASKMRVLFENKIFIVSAISS